MLLKQPPHATSVIAAVNAQRFGDLGKGHQR
jgi:hypothetical protein